MKASESLKQIRSELRLTQHAFALLLGINRDAYANYEIGRNRCPADVYIRATELSKTKGEPSRSGNASAK